jgi:hypothetical protein
MKTTQPHNDAWLFRLLIIVATVVLVLLTWQLWLVEKRMQALDNQLEVRQLKK